MELNNFGNLTYLVKMCVFSLFFSHGGMGIFKLPRWGVLRNHRNPRSCGADREGSQLLERVEGAVTRDLDMLFLLLFFFNFSEDDEDVG